MTKYILSYVLIAFLALISCKKTEYKTYSGSNYAYLGRMYTDYSPKYYDDTFKFNYNYANSLDSIIYLEVASSGFASDTIRHFDLDITSNNANDYSILNKDSFYIPIDTGLQIIKLKVLRDVKFTDSTYLITINLNANQNFRTDIIPDTFNLFVTSGKPSTQVFVHRYISVTDSLLTPSNWLAYSNLLGTFSSKKLRLFIKTINIPIGGFYTTKGITISSVLLKNYAKSFQDSLSAWNKLGKTTYEKNGQIMLMGPDVQ